MKLWIKNNKTKRNACVAKGQRKQYDSTQVQCDCGMSYKNISSTGIATTIIGFPIYEGQAFIESTIGWNIDWKRA